MPRLQTTTYGGMLLTEAEARELRTLPAADFLSFRTLPEGRVLMGGKLPEMGQGDRGAYHIRENFNWFMRGFARGCLGENGDPDPKKMAPWLDEVAEWLDPYNGMDVPREFLELCGIPKEKEADFRRFLADPEMRDMVNQRINESVSGFGKEIDVLGEMAYLGEHRDDPIVPDDPERAEKEAKNELRQRLFADSYEDYRNCLSAYRAMADADPETETRILFPIDCHDYAKLNMVCLSKNNAWREENGLPVIDGQMLTLSFIDQQGDPAHGIVRAFDNHSVFTLNVPDGDDWKKISLETTAPPLGKCVFHPSAGKIGVGIWEDGEAIYRYHAERNLVNVENEALENEVRYEAISKGRELTAFPRDAALERECSLRAFSSGPERSWHDIRLARRVAMIREEKLTNAAADAVRGKPGAETDAARLTAKETIAILTAEGGEYAAAAAGDPEFEALMPLLREYAAMDVTATHGNYDAEKALYDKITGQLDKLFERMDAAQIEVDSDLPENRTRYLACANLMNLMESERDGRLMKNGDEITVDGTAHKIENTRDLTVQRVVEDVFDHKGRVEAKDAPLFPHEPCPGDVSQGALGDCYLLAGLSSLAERWPEQIKRNLHDNGDGTVTVRFWKKDPPSGNPDEISEKAQFKPVLVTVDKVYNRTAGADDCLWVQTIERAYTASGLHLTDDPYISPVPADVDAKYEAIASGADTAPHGREDLPWLYDKNGKFGKWQPDYTQIEAGGTYRFLEQFLGPDGIGEKIDTSSYSEPEEELYRLAREAKAKHDASGVPGMMVSLLREAVRSKLGNREFDGQFDELTVPALLHNYANGARGGQADEVEESVCNYLPDAFNSAIRTAVNADPQWEDHPAQVMEQALTELETVARGVADGTITKRDVAQNTVPGSALGLIQVKAEIESSETDLPPFDTLLTSMLADMRAAIPTVAPRAKELVDAEPELRRQVDELDRRKIQPFKYHGLRLGDQKLLDDIVSALDRGDVVSAGTPGDTDRTLTDGLVNRHAYSVLGVHRKTVEPGGPELTFVRVRNPWGTTGRQGEGMRYVMKNGAVTLEGGTGDAVDGVIDVEISDFRDKFDTLCINHVSPELLAAEKKNASALDPAAAARFDDRIGRAELARTERERRMREEAAAPGREHSFRMEGDTRILWGNALREIRAALTGTKSAFSNDSPAYRSFLKDLTALTDHRLGALTGKDDHELADAMMKVADRAEIYLDHAREDPKSGSRRETRVHAASAILALTDAARKGFADPAEYFRDKLIGRFYETIRQEQLERNEAASYKQSVNEMFDDPERRARAFEQIRSSRAFRSMTEGVGIRRLSALLDSPDTAYADFRSRLRKLDPPPAERAAAERAPAAPEAQNGEPHI